MCGLMVSPSGYSQDRLDAAMARMGHRGDGEPGHRATARFGAWAISHVRLAIQDQSDEANQPFAGKLGAYAFVGEFFNHREGEKRHLLDCMTDEHLFHQTDGFWSAAAIFKNGARVYTDHLGIKPLYYWPRYDLVCSEIEPMFELETPPPLDRVYLSNCIKFGYDYSGRTPYEGIVQLAPGTRLDIMTDGTCHKSIYWKWGLVPRAQSLREELGLAIENRLIGERAVAMLLSGGLDSSAIYYTLQRLGRQVEAFSVENDESQFLPAGVTILDLPPVEPAEAVEVMGAPLDLGSLVPQIRLARAVAAEGFNVCLTGDGADEVFGGYRRAMEYDSQGSDLFCELPYYHLPRLDKVMMHSTIELRSPYLAPSVVAWGLAVPYEYRTQKQALKAAMRGVVPDQIIDRPKHPLKTTAVAQGGLSYRKGLVDDFIDFTKRSIYQ